MDGFTCLRGLSVASLEIAESESEDEEGEEDDDDDDDVDEEETHDPHSEEEEEEDVGGDIQSKETPEELQVGTFTTRDISRWLKVP